MQAGSAVQDELIDFISASRRDDLAKLLRDAGELLPAGGGGDGIAAHRSVLMGYLTRAPGHLVLALRAMRVIPDDGRAVRLRSLGVAFPLDVSVASSPGSAVGDQSFGAGSPLPLAQVPLQQPSPSAGSRGAAASPA